MTARNPAKTLTIASAAVAACLAGCASEPKTAKAPPAPEALTPTEQYAPTVTQAPEQIALAVHTQGLSVNQQAALADFVGRWRDNGGGAVTVSAPFESGDARPARRTADAMISFLQHLGVPADRVRLAGYDARRTPGAPVLASFERYEAVSADCSQGWDNLTSTKNNKPSTHFGCAATANIAQMVANPRDLVTPAASEPADNSRRMVVFGKYRLGVTTSTPRDEQASGTVTQQ